MLTTIAPDWFIPLITFLLTVAFTPLVISGARKMGWVAAPQADRWHKKPVALMGGVAIYFAVTVALVLEASLFVSWLWAGASVMFLTGLLDDRIHLSPVVKLFAQLLSAGLLMFAGYHLVPSLTVWVSVPLTFFWIIGVTNAVNLLDNMDGLSSGVVAIALAVAGGLLLTGGEPALAILVLAVAAASAGFLLYNFKPARVFMGDSGSLFIGYMLAGSVLALINTTPVLDGWSALLVGASIAAVPIFDTTLVTFNRVLRGISPAHGGSDHISHRLVFLGLSERASVLFLYLVAMMFGGLAVWSFYVEALPFYLMFLLGGVGLAIFGTFLSRLPVYEPGLTREIISLANLPRALKSRVKLLGVGIDLVLVIIAFSLAHYIRFENWTPAMEQAILEVAPGVIFIKLVVFYLFGLYKGIWKHAGVMELLRIGSAVLTATALAGAFCWLYAGGFLSVSVFAIDFMLLVLLIAGSRFAFKGLRRVFARNLSQGDNVLIYGAGDAGWLALSEIRQNNSLNMNPVGFVDDSPWKQNGVIQGLHVLGTGNNLRELCRDHKVDVVLITISELPDDVKRQIHKQCVKAGVDCKIFNASFTDVHRPEEEKFPDYHFKEVE